MTRAQSMGMTLLPIQPMLQKIFVMEAQVVDKMILYDTSTQYLKLEHSL